MPIRLAVHVGPHKTGSTSVQRALVAHRERLAEAGVWYPPSLERAEFPDQHADIAGLLIKGGVDQVVAWLMTARSEAAQRGCDTLFLSSENFRAPMIRRRLVGALRRFRRQAGAETRLLYVCRSHQALARSQVMARLDGELGFFFRERYDLRSWAADFRHQQRREEQFFARHRARFLQLEATPPASLASELLRLATDRDHGFVETGRANVTAARLAGPPAAMQAYGLRVMQKIIGGAPIVGTTAARVVSAAATPDDATYPRLLTEFEAAVAAAIAAGFADADGESVWQYRWRLAGRHLAEIRRLW
ncbi:MAG: hypothetical protein RLZZ440_1331 [Planctomycetota bacterium]